MSRRRETSVRSIDHNGFEHLVIYCGLDRKPTRVEVVTSPAGRSVRVYVDGREVQP